jgi:hypothetical protein
MLIISVVAVLVAASAVLAFFLVLRHPKPTPKPAYNPFNEQAVALEETTPPEDPLQRAIYYGQIAQNYEHLKNWDKTLQNYLRAQTVIEDAHLQDQYVFYQALADTYHAKGDTSNEKLYLQKQLTFLQAYAQQHTDDEATVKAIQSVKERLQKL